jgi:hypothetical protein
VPISKHEEVFDFMDVFQELRVSLARARKHIIGITLFGYDDFGPDDVLITVQLPNPLEKHINIHFSSV